MTTEFKVVFSLFFLAFKKCVKSGITKR